MLKDPIKCPYCPARAFLLTGSMAHARNPATTRYGCTNAHYFAVPTSTVEQKESSA